MLAVLHRFCNEFAELIFSSFCLRRHSFFNSNKCRNGAPWRAVGNAVPDVTISRFGFQTSRSKNKSVKIFSNHFRYSKGRLQRWSPRGHLLKTSASKLPNFCAKTFFFNGERLKFREKFVFFLRENVFFLFEKHLRVVSLALSIPVFGFDRVCPRKVGLGLGFFFIYLASIVVSSNPPLVNYDFVIEVER